MVGWLHWLNGHEFEQTPGDSEGQGSLVCCSPRGGKELDVTQWLKNNNNIWRDNQTNIWRQDKGIYLKKMFCFVSFWSKGWMKERRKEKRKGSIGSWVNILKAVATCHQHSDAESRVQVRIPVNPLFLNLWREKGKKLGVFSFLMVFSAGSGFPATDAFPAHLAGIGDNVLWDCLETCLEVI